MKMQWKVKEFLEDHDLNAFALVNKTHGKLSHNTVYALARGEPKRIALETLEEVITALRDMTGKPVNIQDLLEYAPAPAAEPEAMDEETKAWLEADLAPPLEPDAHGELEPDELGGELLRYEPGRGWVSNG